MANESKLKKLLTELTEDALKLQVDAMKEIVEAEFVATSYVNAIKEIRDLCEERKRY